MKQKSWLVMEREKTGRARRSTGSEGEGLLQLKAHEKDESQEEEGGKSCRDRGSGPAGESGHKEEEGAEGQKVGEKLLQRASLCGRSEIFRFLARQKSEGETRGRQARRERRPRRAMARKRGRG